MKLIIFLFLLPLALSAQRVVTLDPAKDAVARRTPEGAIQFVVSTQALTISIQESLPQIREIQTIGIQKIGKSNYIIASGKGVASPEVNVSVAILLAETSPGEFQVDNLIISCASNGDCRECSLPPLCKCTKGEGACGQNATLMTALKKITLTLFD